MERTFNRRKFLAGMAATATAASFPVSRVFSQGKVDFSGKTIQFVIPFSEGGGSDVWARFYAPYLSKYLPGKPNVVVRNVPGGGSITGTNQFVARARPD